MFLQRSVLPQGAGPDSGYAETLSPPAPAATGRRVLWHGLILALLAVTSWYNYLLFHSLAELYSIVIAFGIFLIAWNARHHYQNDYLLFIGIAYPFIAFFDTLHVLGYHGMTVFKAFPGYNLGPQLWLVGRSFEACTLLAAPLFIRRPLRIGPTFAVYLLLSSLALWSIFATRTFPVCFTPESGLTTFKIATEYVIIAILLAALTLLAKHRSELDRRVYRLLYASIVLTVASELCFTLYISHYGLSNLAGHLFKIVSFTLIYYAIIETALRRPFALLFHDLKERQEGMLAAQRAAKLGSWSWRSGKREMTWTEEMFRQLGLPPGTPPTLASFLGAFPQDKRHPLQQALDALQQEGTPFKLELERPGAENRLLYLRIEGARSLDEQGEPMLAGVVKDVTERVATERLRKDIDLVTRHDLRSPLTPIIGIPDLLLTTGANLNAEQREMLSDIRQSGLKMLAMLNNSLTLYKIEQGTCQLQPEIFDLYETLREVWREVSAKAGIKSEIRLRGNGRAPDAMDRFYCYGERLLCHTLFANLIGNALEASPAGEEVTITISEDQQAWQVAIHNAGTVPEAVRAHFFEKYATYGKKGGTGLGTYSALLVARAHGGAIQLDTGEAGTTLTVILPKPEEFNVS